MVKCGKQRAGHRRSAENLEQFRGRSREAVDPQTFTRPLVALRAGRVQSATFQVRRAWFARRPAFNLAIPPALFGLVVEQLEKSGCAAGARVIVENRLERTCRRGTQSHPDGTFPEKDIPHHYYLGKRPVQNFLLQIRKHVSGAVLESELRRKRADHDGGRFWRQGRAPSMIRRARFETLSRTICSKSCRTLPWSPNGRECLRDERSRF
jgi:hypothetical protein